jgi:two-component system, OmpR family, response regulator RstA
MSHTNGSNPKSVIFLTNDESASGPLVEALVKEKFIVNLHPQEQKYLDGFVAKDMDLFIVELADFSLNDLSTYTHLRAVYTGLMMVLTTGMDEMLQILLYEQGVDEILLQPVAPLLVLARIRALLRRNNKRMLPASLVFDGLEINGGLRRVSYLGEEIALTTREFDLLWYMAKNACITLDRDHLYKDVFGIEYNGYDRSIDMYIARIRSKMAPYTDLPQMIKTVRNRGYLFAAER